MLTAVGAAPHPKRAVGWNPAGPAAPPGRPRPPAIPSPRVPPETPSHSQRVDEPVSGWLAQHTLRMADRPGWTLPPSHLPSGLALLLHHPGPVQDALARHTPNRRLAAVTLDQHPVRALAEVSRWLRIPSETPILRHREVLQPAGQPATGQSGDQPGGGGAYSEARWWPGHIGDDFARRLAARGLAATLAAISAPIRVELLWGGRWTPTSDQAMLGRVWRVVTDRGPILLVHDALCALSPATPSVDRHPGHLTPPAGPGPTRPAPTRAAASTGAPPTVLDPANAPGNTVTCLECGKVFGSLASHLRTHNLTATEYRRRHGVSTSTRSSAASAVHQRSRADAAVPAAWTAVTISGLRGVLGISRTVLAELLDTRVVNVARWERGVSQPHPAAQRALHGLHRTLDEAGRARFAGLVDDADTTAARDAATDPPWTSVRITALRAVLGLSKTEFAELTHACPSTVLNWETRDRQPSPAHRCALDRVLRVLSPDDRARFTAYIRPTQGSPL